MEFTIEHLSIIIESANEVITALDGTNEDIHPEDSKKMCEAWDHLNDRAAPPEVVKRLAEIALAALTAEPVGEVVLGEYDNSGCHPDARVVCIAADGQADWENFKDGTRLYATPPTPVVPKELLSAMEEVLRISDRDHDAWHKAKAGIVSCRAAMLQGAEPSQPTDDERIMEMEGLITTCAEPVSQRDELPVLGWVRSDYQDEKSKCDAPLFVSGGKDPSSAWGVDYMPLGNSALIPDGYALVPVEPTEDMVIHGFESVPHPLFQPADWDKYQTMSGCEQAAHRAKLCWAAMIAAAPQQEAE